MSQKLTYALIGCGRIAPNHIAAALKYPEQLEIVAVCDPIASHREQILALVEEPLRSQIKQYDDYQVMLKELHPQLIAIATESGKHAAIGLDCLNHKASLIIEKPIALSIADADALIKAAQDNGVKLCACHQNRFNKSIQKIREAVEADRFGRLLHGTAHIRWNRGQDYYTQAPWRGTWAQDGGALMNQCIHNIDLLRWMMGDEVSEVFAYTANMKHPYIEAEDLGMALVKFTNGALGIIEGTTNIFPKNLEETLYLFGDTGTVKAGGKSVNIIEEWNFADQLDVAQEVKAIYQEQPTSVYGFGHTPLYGDVIDAIIHDRDPYVDGPAGKRALELILAIYQSAATGQAVKLPLAAGSTLDFVGRFD